MWSRAFIRLPTLFVHRLSSAQSAKRCATVASESRVKESCDRPEVRKYLSEIVVSRRIPETVPNVVLLRDVCLKLTFYRELGKPNRLGAEYDKGPGRLATIHVH